MTKSTAPTQTQTSGKTIALRDRCKCSFLVCFHLSTSNLQSKRLILSVQLLASGHKFPSYYEMSVEQIFQEADRCDWIMIMMDIL